MLLIYTLFAFSTTFFGKKTQFSEIFSIFFKKRFDFFKSGDILGVINAPA